jgi:predicted PurR-regulated permease PerM
MDQSRDFLRDRFVERVILLTLLALLAFACLQIVRPFIGAMLWGIIIAVSTWHPYRWLAERLGGRKKIAAALMSVGLLLVLVVPVSMLVNSLAEGVAAVAGLLRDLTTVHLPAPPDWLRGLPVVGATLDDRWREAMVDLPAALERLQPYIGTAAAWGLSWGADLGFAVLEFVIAVVIAAILYVTGETANKVLRRFVARIGGSHHIGLIDVAAQTIRGVAAGIIFTAFLQAVLLVFGLVVVGAPGPVVLGFLTFFLLVLQLPNWLVWLPIVVWLGYKGETGFAIFLFIWGFFIVSTIDNFIRPYMISQGAKLPLLLIFVGVIGGLLAYGFIGLFIGATLLGVGYTLFLSWLDEEPPPTRDVSF